ncbi:TolC family protein [Chryseobacterium sp.]|mgnify:CR=1 FL=1|uniref:TolC family protein n=1 Tax=Chryseobacterium sp. TaxID=1871047 RepID=UPI0025C31F2F|nr:TolC family protein [Chryseobacterium sp.]
MRHSIVILIFFFTLFSPAKAQVAYTLSQAVKAAENNNPFIKASSLNVSIAKTDITSAKLIPNLVLSNETLHISKKSHLTENTSWLNNQNLQASWQLTKTFQLAGQRKNKIEAAHSTTRISEIELDEIRRELHENTANKWIEVWVSQKESDLLSKALNNIDSLVHINAYRFKKEVITETELYRTELLSKQYKIQLKNTRQEYNQLLNELKFLIGQNDEIIINDNEDYIIEFPPSLDSLIQIAYENRPDIKALKETQHWADVNIKLQKSLAIPQPEIGIIYNPQNAIPYIGLAAAIELPFFSRNQGEIEKAQIQKKQAEYQFEAIRKNLHTEVSNAWTQYRVYRQNVDEYNYIIRQSQQVLNNVKYAYTRGGTTIIDFLEAQRSWLETQQQYFETIKQYRQSEIQLLNSIGLLKNLAR